MKSVVEVCEQNNIKYSTNSSFKNITTLKVGGNISLLCEPDTLKKLEELMRVIWSINIKYKVIGYGSNILASDDFFEGVVIKLKGDFEQIYVLSSHTDVGAGVSLAKVVKLLASIGNSGLEFGSCIPATIGGAIYGNAGANGSDIASVISEVHILTKDGIKKLSNSELGFKYRTSVFKEGKIKDFIIIKAILKLAVDSVDEIHSRISLYDARRNSAQPKGVNSAGSFFKNSVDYSAWSLIDKCGLRGYNVGDAMVNDMHTNFLINLGEAKSIDFINLVSHIKQEVFNKFQIALKEEIEYFNFKDK